jgi:hypothetical protein
VRSQHQILLNDALELLDNHMLSPELLASWVISTRHLAACRYYLPRVLISNEAVVCYERLENYLHHNELELALDEGEMLGKLCDAPPQFWRELQLAALNMDLLDRADHFEKLQAKLS